MLRINQIKLRPNHDKKALETAVRKVLKLKREDNVSFLVAKRSLDSRHKPDLLYIYSVDVTEIVCNKKKVDLKRKIQQLKNKDVIWLEHVEYSFPKVFEKAGKKLELLLENDMNRPVIIGFGPAGLFAALKLAKAGLRPVVYERGDNVEKRKLIVEDFWSGRGLDLNCNVQFGEGGAGTFSDGKLNTMIKDTTGRIKEVLKVFVEFGADPSILYVNKPHIGTDVLSYVVKNIRQHIIQLGGEVHFRHRLDNIIIDSSRLKGIEVTDLDTNKKYVRKCRNVCIAVGHSARDTFFMLSDKKIAMEAKAFAVGLRIEHPQSYVDFNSYGDSTFKMPAADYKVTYQTGQRGVYSFCMCPGGYVVNASSENGMTACNGMSYSGRNGKNANSAMIVTVTPKDFGAGVLDGIAFQRKLEKAAYEAGNGSIPVQLFADYEENRETTGFGAVTPAIKGSYKTANLRNVLPDEINLSLIEGIHGCARFMKGFDMEEAVLSGVESRTSSPLRILRNDRLESVNCEGLYPCGEGAGYAGGITSAAVDGIKVAEKIALNMDF
ncbi:MAG: FAD-dependent oxidoreductase [Eubacteriales bacterium]|nr:FAD-dependent oxidoreductase [Eubacteriales bacterium]